MSFLKQYFEREQVEMVVIGYPKQLNNTPSQSVIFIDQFVKDFEKTFPGVKYCFMDERFTSKLASQTILDGGIKKMKRQDRGLVDKISAVIILQSYLEMRQNLKNYL